MRVLIATEAPFTAASIKALLTRENLICDTTGLGDECLQISKLYDYEIILLDLKSRDVGCEMLRRMRRARVVTPILMLSDLAEPNDKVEALNCGADDFLTKPFDPRELVARIRAVIRRSNGHSASVIRTGRLEVNLDTRVASVDDREVHLTGKEYDILELLSLRKGKTLLREMMLNHLYGGIDEPELKIIDAFVCRLRKKLVQATGGKHYIETVLGRGYVLRDPVATPEAGQDLGVRHYEADARAAEEGAVRHSHPPGLQTAQTLGRIGVCGNPAPRRNWFELAANKNGGLWPNPGPNSSLTDERRQRRGK